MSLSATGHSFLAGRFNLPLATAVVLVVPVILAGSTAAAASIRPTTDVAVANPIEIQARWTP